MKDEIATIDADDSKDNGKTKYEPMIKFENVVASWNKVSNATITI